MKKAFKSLLSLFLAVFMVASLVVIPSSAASISKTSLTLTKGYQTTLSVSGASNVKWSTGNKSIATVSSKGKVVGKGIGSTYIYAKTSSKTFKCKVTVVAAKITASNSTVELDSKGDSQIVTMTVKGTHSGLTVGTTNRKVASASWVRPVEWDGNKVKIRITAKGEGTCKIKVYLKKYSKTCYKYINVNVGDSMYEEDPDEDNSNSDMVLVAYPQNIEVNAGTTSSFQIYCSDLKNMSYSVSNSNIATISAGTTSGKYKTYNVKGLTSGTVTVRFYDKNNTKKYVDVTVKVGGNIAYYEFYTVSPTKLNYTDNIVKIPVGNVTYYMLVPSNYDPAYVNTLVAQKFNKYSYYEVYNSVPFRMNSGDTYYDFVHSNSAYNYGTRYIPLPANYDKVKLNTAVAKYNNRYEYYTVYNVRPTVQNNWDFTDVWTVYDMTTGTTVTRYMLLPYNYDQDKANKIKSEDTNNYNAYQYYVPYDNVPDINNNSDQLFIYTKNGKARYMVVPKKNMDIVKRNDKIREDTGVYEAYVMYSTSPTANAANGEEVWTVGFGGSTCFVLCRPGDPNHEALWKNVATAAPRGN